jgi:hypothetical protein
MVKVEKIEHYDVEKHDDKQHIGQHQLEQIIIH